MPYRDPEKRRAYDRERKRKARARAKLAASRPTESDPPRGPLTRPPGENGRAHPQPSLYSLLAGWLADLTLSEGERSGEKLEVMSWQRDFLRGAFREGVSVAGLSMARGNAKSATVAGLATAAVHPEGPLHVERGHTVIVAGSLAQAESAFSHVAWFLRALGVDLGDRKTWRYQHNRVALRVEHVATGARVECRGAVPDLLHGLAPRLILADEPAKWARAQGRKMFTALETSLGKVEGGRLLALGTRPAMEGHWFARLLDDPGEGEYSLCYSAPEGSDPWDPATWAKANPSLGCPGFSTLAATVAAEARKARKDPALRPGFMAYRLNMGTSEVDEGLVLDLGVYRERCETEDLPARSGPWYLGLDLGGQMSMSAAAAYWPESGRLEVFGAWPGEPSLAERGAAHHVADLYERMAKEGGLIILGVHSVSASALLAEALSRWGRPAGITADYWRVDDMKEALVRLGLNLIPFEASRNNYQDGGARMNEFRRAVRDGEVATAPSLLLRAALAEARTRSFDGMERLAAGSSGGRRQLSRDDALAASILAVSSGAREHRRRGGAPPSRSTRTEPEAARRLILITDSGEAVYSDGSTSRPA